MPDDKVKARDCVFAADVEVSERSSESAKSAPVRVVARSGDAIDHHYWGRIVHDLSGMQHKNKIPLDFNHDVNEIVGYANKFNIDSGDLEIKGALTPYKENDRATEILAKAELGVPWEASVNFAGPMEIERVTEGTVEVNGRTFDAPLTVVRKWLLRGVAITPYGYDPQTSATALSSDRDISVQVKEASEMSDQPLVPPMEEEKENTQLSVEAASEAVETQEADSDRAEVTESTEQTLSAVEAPNDRATDGAKFMACFGEERGALYFAQGLSFEEALATHMQFQAEQINELTNRLSAQQSGEDSPVSFSAGDEVKKKEGLTKPAHPSYGGNRTNT